MGKKIVAGNWKMNKSFNEAMELVNQLVDSSFDNDVEMVLFPPSLYATELVNSSKQSVVSIGLQNVSEHDEGAYTGEIAASMIASIGANYCLVGHSERREYFGEQNDVLAKKIDQLLLNKITPVYCCGEVLVEREKDNHFNLVESQISEGLFHLSEQEFLKCIIAYEPVWAIGTGVTASSSQAQEMHAFIRGLVDEKYGKATASQISILYGGSCNPNNAKELFACKDVDGGLIGGASLVAEKFLAIANSF